MFVGLLLTAAVILIVYTLYKWATANNDYFERRGLKSMKPAFLLGNTGKLLLSKITAVEFANKIYYAFPEEP